MSLGPFAYNMSKTGYSERRVGTLILAAILLITFVKILYGTSGYYFFSDDFLNFIIASDMGLTWEYLARSAQGEFIPLYRMANWLYFNIFGLAFWPYRILLATHQCAVVTLIASMIPCRNLRLEFLMPLLALSALTPVFESSFQWWSAAINVLSEALASLIAIRFACDVAPMTIRRIALSTMFYTASLCFFPKGIFVAELLLSLRIFAAFERGETYLLRGIVVAGREVWPVFAAGVAYTAIVVFGHYSSAVAPPSPILLVHYIWHGWNHGFVTGLLGLDRQFFGRVVCANLLIFGAVYLSIRRNPRTLILWAGFSIYFVVAVATIAVSRATLLGLASSELTRYYTDISCFFVAFLIIGLSEPGVLSDRKLHLPRFAASALTTALLSIHLLNVSAREPSVWFAPGVQIETFVAQVDTSLKEAKKGTQVQDGVVPDWVMPEWTFPLREYQYFLKLFDASHVTVVPIGGPYKFDVKGRLVDAHAAGGHHLQD